MTIDSDKNGTDDYIILGVHPFMSAFSAGGRVSSASRGYYSVQCYDQAFDLKSQIRIHVREWDRQFTLNHLFMNSVSDIDSSGDILIDNNGEIDDDQQWNDRSDWDDFWVRNSPPHIFVNNNCRDLEEHPAVGTCNKFIGGVWQPEPSLTNKQDCLAGVLSSELCRNGVDTDRTSCLAAGSEWMWTPWESDQDDSKGNFPGKI